MTLALLISVAGGGGSAVRYLVDHAIASGLQRHGTLVSRLPWATFIINTTGSFALGAITASATAGMLSNDLRLILGVGICGGYTTFSTAMVDTLRLGIQRRHASAVVYLVATIAATMSAAAVGWYAVT